MPYQVAGVPTLRYDPHVEGWYRGLLSTEGVRPEDYLEHLHRFSRRSNLHPQELLQLPPSHQRKLIGDFQKWEKSMGRDARDSIAAVRSWIEYRRK